MMFFELEKQTSRKDGWVLMVGRSLNDTFCRETREELPDRKKEVCPMIELVFMNL
jgi:hypothetical protein